MKNKIPIILWIALVALLVSMACCHAQSYQTNVLYGTVGDYGLRPQNRVTVTLTLVSPNPRFVNNIAIRQDPIATTTDTNGYFGFTNQQFGNYTYALSGAAGTVFKLNIFTNDNGSIPIGSRTTSATFNFPSQTTNSYSIAEVNALLSGIQMSAGITNANGGTNLSVSGHTLTVPTNYDSLGAAAAVRSYYDALATSGSWALNLQSAHGMPWNGLVGTPDVVTNWGQLQPVDTSGGFVPFITLISWNTNSVGAGGGYGLVSGNNNNRFSYWTPNVFSIYGVNVNTGAGGILNNPDYIQSFINNSGSAGSCSPRLVVKGDLGRIQLLGSDTTEYFHANTNDVYGLKFTDSYGQLPPSTSILTNVSHDGTLSGSGTSGSPLSVLPIEIFDNVYGNQGAASQVNSAAVDPNIWSNGSGNLSASSFTGNLVDDNGLFGYSGYVPIANGDGTWTWGLTGADWSAITGEQSYFSLSGFNNNLDLTDFTDNTGIASQAADGETAYGWGNHADAGYLMSGGWYDTDQSSVSLSGFNNDLNLSYSGSLLDSAASSGNGGYVPIANGDGTWTWGLTGADWSAITGEQSYFSLSGFNNNLDLTDFTDNTGIASQAADGETAYGWGNHADAGYLMSGGWYDTDQSSVSLSNFNNNLALSDFNNDLGLTPIEILDYIYGNQGATLEVNSAAVDPNIGSDGSGKVTFGTSVIINDGGGISADFYSGSLLDSAASYGNSGFIPIANGDNTWTWGVTPFQDSSSGANWSTTTPTTVDEAINRIAAAVSAGGTIPIP